MPLGKLYRRRQLYKASHRKFDQPQQDPLGPPDRHGVRKRVPRKKIFNAKLMADFRP